MVEAGPCLQGEPPAETTFQMILLDFTEACILSIVIRSAAYHFIDLGKCRNLLSNEDRISNPSSIRSFLVEDQGLYLYYFYLSSHYFSCLLVFLETFALISNYS